MLKLWLDTDQRSCPRLWRIWLRSKLAWPLASVLAVTVTLPTVSATRPRPWLSTGPLTVMRSGVRSRGFRRLSSSVSTPPVSLKLPVTRESPCSSTKK